MNFIYVFIGGGLGSVTRYGVGIISKRAFASTFPFATLISNVCSSFILGILVGWLALKASNQEPYRLLIAIGFCGGFSTFSSFSLETYEMIRTGQYLTCGINVLSSIIVCLVALWGGIQLARSF